MVCVCATGRRMHLPNMAGGMQQVLFSLHKHNRNETTGQTQDTAGDEI